MKDATCECGVTHESEDKMETTIEKIESFPLGGGLGDSTAIMWLLTKVTELEARIALLEERLGRYKD